MRVEYFPSDKSKNKGPSFILRPESRVEQRLLTVWRNLLLGKPYRMRVTGSENSEKSEPGLPPNPVLAVAMCIEDTDGKAPQEYLGEVSEDPSKDTPPAESRERVISSVGGRKGMRVTTQQRKGGPTTVIQE